MTHTPGIPYLPSHDTPIAEAARNIANALCSIGRTPEESLIAAYKLIERQTGEILYDQWKSHAQAHAQALQPPCHLEVLHEHDEGEM